MGHKMVERSCEAYCEALFKGEHRHSKPWPNTLDQSSRFTLKLSIQEPRRFGKVSFLLRAQSNHPIQAIFFGKVSGVHYRSITPIVLAP